jgi:hypothetical protein
VSKILGKLFFKILNINLIYKKYLINFRDRFRTILENSENILNKRYGKSEISPLKIALNGR